MINTKLIEQNYNVWTQSPFDKETISKVNSLKETNNKDFNDSFYTDLSFGTGGMRGVVGVGPNRVNKYTFGRNTQGISNYINNYSKNHTLNSNEKYFIKKYFFSQYSKKNIIYDNILSDEGGRFYQCQIRYMISKLLYPDSIKIPNNYIWISHNQIVDMIRDQKLDIEARLLFACANLDYIY